MFKPDDCTTDIDKNTRLAQILQVELINEIILSIERVEGGWQFVFG